MDEGNGSGGGGGCDGCGGGTTYWPLRNAFIMSCSSFTPWLRLTMEVVTSSGVNTRRGATVVGKDWEGGTTRTPAVAGGAVEAVGTGGIAGDGTAEETAGVSMIDKVSGTKLIGTEVPPLTERRL